MNFDKQAAIEATKALLTGLGISTLVVALVALIFVFAAYAPVVFFTLLGVIFLLVTWLGLGPFTWSILDDILKEHGLSKKDVPYHKILKEVEKKRGIR